MNENLVQLLLSDSFGQHLWSCHGQNVLVAMTSKLLLECKQIVIDFCMKAFY